MQQPGGSELVVVINQKLDEAMDKLGPTTSIAKSGSNSRSAFEAGMKAAEEIGLDTQVTAGGIRELKAG